MCVTEGRTVQHVTLMGGSSRASSRSEIAEEMLTVLRTEVLPALAACGAVTVPWHVDYRLRLAESAAGGMAMVLETAGGTELLRIAIGWADPGASVVWRGLAGVVEEPPRPWCADVLALEALTELADEGLSVAMWSGEMARCLAWAVLDDETGARR